MKKLRGNGIFEGSRIIYPEHREAWTRRRNELERMEHRKPNLDEQEIRHIEFLLVDSFNNRKPITLTVYHEVENKRYIGIVTIISASNREIKLTVFKDEWHWINIGNIVSANL
ncbi:YolD-like family protein [Paenibacillus sp. PDC88]|uniref:YolD-like family protein n=2 Tax=Bacillati TaxID=1783272 RepID=A0ABW3Q1X7_9BACL|nr:YolD-like family protein [Paenibacillus sp. PDC88]SDX87802.1 YolD-like protein [Paenibacillus sp. PDC88]SFS99272.1 YolD-like protein [Paenibacillus sp. 453mf]